MARPKNRSLEYESRLDWLQLGSFSDDVRRRKFVNFMTDLKLELISDGHDRLPVSFPRYTGEQIGPFKFMLNPSTSHQMIIASGGNAPMLAKIAIEREVEAKPSRADAAVTMTFSESQPGYGEWARERIHANDRAKGRKTQTALELYDARHADSGIRSAAKKSDIKWRLYDWGFLHQQRTDSLIWRLEVQTHEMPAIKFWNDYRASSDTNKLCAEMVVTRFEKLGVKEPAFKGLEPRPISGTRSVSTLEKSLIHVDRSICSYLKRLIEEGGAPDLRAIFRSHGLVNEDGIFLPEDV